LLVLFIVVCLFSLEYRLLKNRNKLLLKDHNKIDYKKYKYDRTLKYTTTENHVLEKILSINTDLKIAYVLKCQFHDFINLTREEYDAQTPEYWGKRFDDIISAMKDSNVKEMIDCAKSFRGWRNYILSSFVWINDRRLSNGPIEGKNNYVKKILSNANGFSNFPRARNKIMYSQNQYEMFSLSPLDKNEIIRNFPKRGPYKGGDKDE